VLLILACSSIAVYGVMLAGWSSSNKFSLLGALRAVTERFYGARYGPPLTADALARFEALKAWRAQVAREHNLPAYVIFHDATLAAIAALAPATLHELRAVSGIGERKLQAYGADVLRVVADA